MFRGKGVSGKKVVAARWPPWRGGNWGGWGVVDGRGKRGEREERLERKQRGGDGGQAGGGSRIVNAGQCALAGSQAAKPWQLVSLCVSDLIDHKPPPSLLPVPFPTQDQLAAVLSSGLWGQTSREAEYGSILSVCGPHLYKTDTSRALFDQKCSFHF